MGVRRLLLAFYVAGALALPLNAVCYGPADAKGVVPLRDDAQTHPGMTTAKRHTTQDEPGGTAQLPIETDTVNRRVSDRLAAVGAPIPTQGNAAVHPAVSDMPSPAVPTQNGDTHVSDVGLKVRALNDTERHDLGIAEGGLKVVSVVAGSAQQAGFRTGDVVLTLDGVEITSPNQFRQLMRQRPHDRPVPVLVHRSNNDLFLPLNAPGL